MKTLKRIMLVVAAVMIFAGSANAKVLRFGVKAGANFNRLSLNSEIVNDFKNKANSTGWEAGVMMEGNVPLIGLGFDLSLMYARMNNNGQIVDKYGNEFEGGKNFLMIPLNVKYKITLPVVGKLIAPYVFTGPNFNLNLGKKTFSDFKNKTCQVAWNLGLGVELLQHLQVGASYNFGLGKIGNSIINSTLGTNQNMEYTVKNNYWMVTAAYLF